MVKMKYKSLIIIGVVFFISIISFLIIRNSRNPKSFSYFIGTNGSNISKIAIFNGNNGKEFSTTDKIKIKELIILLNNTHYRKSSDQRRRLGFEYFYTLYVGNRTVLKISDINNSRVKINKTYYDVIEGQNNRVQIWYNSLLD